MIYILICRRKDNGLEEVVRPKEAKYPYEGLTDYKDVLDLIRDGERFQAFKYSFIDVVKLVERLKPNLNEKEDALDASHYLTAGTNICINSNAALRC